MKSYIFLLLILLKYCHCLNTDKIIVEVDISNYSQNRDNSPTKELIQTIPHSELEAYNDSFVEILSLQSAEDLKPSDGLLNEQIINISNFDQEYGSDITKELNKSSSDTIKFIEAIPNSALESDTEINRYVESFKQSDGLMNEKIIDITNFNQDYVSDNTDEFNDSSSDTIEIIEAIPNSELEADTEINLSDLNNEDDISDTVEEDTQDTVSYNAIAQWVAAIIFSAILIYMIIFIIYVAIIECKGRGRRTTDTDKIGSSSEEKQKLLNGTAASDHTQDYYPIYELENCNKGYTEVDLSLDNLSDKTLQDSRADLHHILGSPVREVEVFPHGTLRPPSNKGCLQFQNDIIS